MDIDICHRIATKGRMQPLRGLSQGEMRWPQTIPIPKLYEWSDARLNDGINGSESQPRDRVDDSQDLPLAESRPCSPGENRILR